MKYISLILAATLSFTLACGGASTPEEAAKKITEKSSAKDDAAALCSCIEGAVDKSTKDESMKAYTACTDIKKNEAMIKKMKDNKDYEKEFVAAFEECEKPLKEKAQKKFEKSK